VFLVDNFKEHGRYSLIPSSLVCFGEIIGRDIESDHGMGWEL
jgi:hypothetical protein